MRDRFITPPTPDDGFTRWGITLPTGAPFIALLKGAIFDLCEIWNWEQVSGVPVEDAQAIFKDAFFSIGVCRMIGEIIPYAADTSPDAKFLLCDGASYLRADYPELFSLIGTVYGSVDSTHFNVPDLRGRVPMGQGTGSGLSSRSIGDTVGEETHTLVSSETPSHTHSDSGHTHSEITAIPAVGAAIVGVPIPSAVPGAGITGVGFAGLSSAGGDGAHNNIQPSLVINYLIVAEL